MPGLPLTDLERWLLISALRAPQRGGSGKGSGHEIDSTADLLEALGAREWDRRCRRAMAHAKTRVRAEAKLRATERGMAPDSPLAEPAPADLEAAAQAAAIALINDLDPEAEAQSYAIDKVAIEYLHDAVEQMHDRKEFSFAHALHWRGLRARIAECYARRADGGATAASAIAG